MQTARTLADQVVEVRREAWDEADPTVAIVATEQLNPEDEQVVDSIVAAAGFTGDEHGNMVRRVKSLVVGQVGASSDNSPADCS